ncbi:hypothetical protein C0583_05865 [Candidatus Parcubacteria bacterium]|nr:MAG: hypothetical protein C0583_05865 [Candidatus Parcubacteria bacterium]
MKYFFVLGKNKAISIAEILSVVVNIDSWELINDDVFLIETKKKIPSDIIKRMGGVIKFGKVSFETKQIDGDEIYKKVMTDLLVSEGKIKFGISDYSLKANFKKEQKLAMVIKRNLKDASRSCRWVTSKEKTLSSVVVEQNLMKDNGVEIVLLGSGDRRLVAQTKSVQAFKELSRRDYGRPSRDDKSGMLPPKLAQIFLNLSGVKEDDVLLDPFCGSGTVLGEALLMGVENLIGTDVSAKAVKDTQNNLTWFEKTFITQKSKKEIFQCDVIKLSKEIDERSVDKIVTEPYLGPQRGQVDQRKIKIELDELYSVALKNFHKILKDKGRVVMVWPVRILGEKKLYLDPDIKGFKNINVLPKELNSKLKRNLSFRNNLLYGRDGQKVWREIVVLEKK